ncbi:MAG: HTH-type transcriptional regulator HdfR [Arsenophonus sp. ET-DL9-MAG3]
MDTELLKTFLEVSKTRHFGRAAESLYLTQSAVSFRIRQLENQLDTILFARHRNNIHLTEAGKRLIPYAESLINNWLQAKKEISHQSLHIEFSIGSTIPLWEGCLTNWIKLIYQKYKELYLECRISTRQSLVKQLHSHKLDLLIAIEPPKMDEFETTIIGEIKLQLMTNKKNLTLKKLNLIELEWSAYFNTTEKSSLLENSPAILTTSANLARELLYSTQSAAVLPIHWLNQYHDLKILSQVVYRKPIYAIWLQNNGQKNFIDNIIKIPIHNN